jgi:hypothetical protein
MCSDIELLFIDLINPSKTKFVRKDLDIAEFLEDHYFGNHYASIPFNEYIVEYTKLLMIDEDNNVKEVSYIV